MGTKLSLCFWRGFIIHSKGILVSGLNSWLSRSSLAIGCRYICFSICLLFSNACHPSYIECYMSNLSTLMNYISLVNEEFALMDIFQ